MKKQNYGTKAADWQAVSNFNRTGTGNLFTPGIGAWKQGK